MGIMDVLQTTGGISGLICLMILLFSVKKQLKQYAGKIE